MTKYYWNSEMDAVESVESIRADYYDLFGNDYNSFDEYLSACMYFNNGVLHDVRDRLKEVKEVLNEKLMLAKKYGMDEYEDEILTLLEDMDKLSRYIRASR